ncbi:MAG TPA: cytochrome P460 family protein [Burkholderiaceae bacterium]|nr:cytochrome P460 family protein [Burkholderiaceae bacterium]
MKRISQLAVIFLAACGTVPQDAPKLEDGEIAMPAGYQSWPKFLSAVQRPDVKQVREIYVNPIGYKTRAGDAYAAGAMFVMENWAAKTNADGTPALGPDGKLVKDKIAKVFLMQKGLGFGSKVPKELKNGDWVYDSYDASGNRIAENFAACRACHLPLAQQDYVQRYDEFFATQR